ncbi:MAG: LuxR C-terminal-related transcriptional regulator [Parvularcula sp.]|jgi:FixJ family two-component response regulator|nr:LuxR C-terminal-related transcriptional regulator [Parvularcula sp.]
MHQAMSDSAGLAQLPKADEPVLHYVDTDQAGRVSFAHCAQRLGYHCEVYDGLDELAAFSPKSGILFIKDASGSDSVANLIGKLNPMGLWLPVIAVGAPSEIGQVVAAIKAGALDYIVSPAQEDGLKTCLAKIAGEVHLALTQGQRRMEARRLMESLTKRESQVLRLLSSAHTNKEIGSLLGISSRTVEIHRANMMNKLGVKHAVDAVRIRTDAISQDIAMH